MLKGDLSCEEMRKIGVWDGEAKVTHDRVSHHPGTGKLVGEPSVRTGERAGGGDQWRLAVGKGAGPVSKSDACHVRKERKVVVKVTQEASDSSAIVQACDRREAKPMKM